MQAFTRERLGSLYLCKDKKVVEDPLLCDNVIDFLDGKRRLLLSKLMSGILRHYPWRIGIKLDERGWAPIDKLVEGIRGIKGFEWVKEWHIRAIATYDPKGRFEILGNKIRARYGHSIPVRIEPLPGEIPEFLYHGTPEENLKSILKEGIKRMKRLKVHLSDSFNSAIEVGIRRSSRVAVLKISTKCLRRLGYEVEKASKVVYTVDYVPPECIVEYKVVEVKNY
jgi:putative RNA 2'-phosphotransferase